jgi:type 1 fimbria pilin
MKKVLSVLVVTILAAVSTSGAALTAAPDASGIAAGAVKVTVHYKGKGTVDGSHKVFVWLFDTPNIGPGSMPIDQVVLDKNGADATFDAVAADKVWVAVAFDEQGAMTGEAQPPPGTPIGILMGADGAPTPITPGPKGAAVLTFDDSIRMP